MRIKAGIALAALVVALGSMGFGHAAECNGEITQIDSPDGSATLYVDNRDPQVGGVWVYQESNGEEGLQSGGQSVILGDQDVDDCDGTSEGGSPDTLLV
jgi:hypothetical protein